MRKRTIYQLLMFLAGFMIQTFPLAAQTRMTSETRFIIQQVTHEYAKSKGTSTHWEELVKTYPLYAQKESFTLSFLAKKNTLFNPTVFTNHGIEIGSQLGDILTLRVPVEVLNQLDQLAGLEYLEVAGKVSPMLDRVLFDTRVDSVHQAINLPEAYTGRDVLIGITDWGFDYSSPMFYDTLLTETRIHAAWDQFKTSGPAPAGYTYGAEFSGDASLLLAQTDTTNFYNRSTHGTHVAGIAGGSGAGTKYRGVAFESEFLMVTIRIDQAAVLDAFNWMKQKADAAGKRLVVNMSWGLYYFGTLDGNSLTSQAIDYLSSQGVVFCNSAGNNGNTNFHLKKNFMADTLRSRVNFYTYSDPNMVGESVNMWGEPNHSFKSQIRLLDAANNVVGQTPLFNTEVDTVFIDTLLTIGADTIWYKLAADKAHPLNQRPHMRLRVNNKTTYKTVLISYADSGTVHYWNVAEMKWGEGNWGQVFTSLGAGYTAGDYNYAISEPAVTKSLITVASHSAEFVNGLGNIIGGSFSTFSSYGPTIDGRMKPDISAPGSNVCSSISSYTTNSYTPVTTVSFNGRDYPFAKLSGTSMSSPAAAGVAALILDANPFLTAQQVKDIIILTAREDSYTGDIPDSGSTHWGHGKLNAYYAIVMALNTVNIQTYAEQGIMVYPNPASDQVFIVADQQNETVYTLNVYSADGKSVMSTNYQWNTPIDVASLPAGIYFLRLSAGAEIYQTKFIKTAR
jgi:minor extracellular serine protease Vpr